MRISYDGIFGYIHRSPSEEYNYQKLRESLSILDPNRFMCKHFRRRVAGKWQGWWDGRHHLISDAKGEFLRGLTSEVLNQAAKMGISIEVDQPYNFIDQQRFSPLASKVDSTPLHGVVLAEHQKRMVRELLMNGGGTAEGVTGSGKTESIALLAKILSQDVPVIFVLVHMIGLMDQAYKRVISRVPDLAPLCGMLGEGKRPKFCVTCRGRGHRLDNSSHPCPECRGQISHRIIFSTQQSLCSSLGLTGSKSKVPEESVLTAWANVGAVIIDECHNVSQNQYQKLLGTLGEVPIFQFSGTPEVDDYLRDHAIIGVGGPIVTRVKRRELEETGFIAKAVACIRLFSQVHEKKQKWMPDQKDKDKIVKVWKVDDSGEVQEELRQVKNLKSEEDERLLLPNYARDQIIVDEERNLDLVRFVEACLRQGRRTLVLCERVAQAYYLTGVFQRLSPDIVNSGYKVLHGAHKLQERNKIKGEFERGDIEVLLASSIFDEGEDLANVGAICLAGGGASLQRQTQRTGRGVRKKNGISNWCPVWFPADDVNSFSKEHTITRLDYLDRAEITSEIAEGSWEEFLEVLEKRYGDG